MLVCASPELISKVGMPARPEDLRNLPCIIDTNIQGQANWRFTASQKQLIVQVGGPVRVNSPIAAMRAALHGLGFALLPSYVAELEIEQGNLIVLLQEFMQGGPSLQAVYPHRRHLPGKVRALIDHLVAWFETHPMR
jgi:DNA-binding transcriptional LysR family regulator